VNTFPESKSNSSYAATTPTTTPTTTRTLSVLTTTINLILFRLATTGRITTNATKVVEPDSTPCR